MATTQEYLSWTEFAWLTNKLATRVQTIPSYIQLNAFSFNASPTTNLLKFNGDTYSVATVASASQYQDYPRVLSVKVYPFYRNQSCELITWITGTTERFITFQLNDGQIRMVMKQAASNMAILPTGVYPKDNEWTILTATIDKTVTPHITIYANGFPYAFSDASVDSWMDDNFVADPSDTTAYFTAAQNLRGYLQDIFANSWTLTQRQILDLLCWTLDNPPDTGNILLWNRLETENVAGDAISLSYSMGGFTVQTNYESSRVQTDPIWEETTWPVWRGNSVCLASGSAALGEVFTIETPIANLDSILSGCILCISGIDIETGEAFRYRLNKGSNNELGGYPLYNGELLPGTVNFEVWTKKDEVTASLSENLKILYSKRSAITRADAINGVTDTLSVSVTLADVSGETIS